MRVRVVCRGVAVSVEGVPQSVAESLASRLERAGKLVEVLKRDPCRIAERLAGWAAQQLKAYWELKPEDVARYIAAVTGILVDPQLLLPVLNCLVSVLRLRRLETKFERGTLVFYGTIPSRPMSLSELEEELRMLRELRSRRSSRSASP